MSRNPRSYRRPTVVEHSSTNPPAQVNYDSVDDAFAGGSVSESCELSGEGRGKMKRFQEIRISKVLRPESSWHGEFNNELGATPKLTLHIDSPSVSLDDLSSGGQTQT
jgi:hypothetical protein